MFGHDQLGLNSNLWPRGEGLYSHYPSLQPSSHLNTFRRDMSWKFGLEERKGEGGFCPPKNCHLSSQLKKIHRFDTGFVLAWEIWVKVGDINDVCGPDRYSQFCCRSFCKWCGIMPLDTSFSVWSSHIWICLSVKRRVYWHGVFVSHISWICSFVAAFQSLLCI